VIESAIIESATVQLACTILWVCHSATWTHALHVSHKSRTSYGSPSPSLATEARLTRSSRLSQELDYLRVSITPAWVFEIRLTRSSCLMKRAGLSTSLNHAGTGDWDSDHTASMSPTKEQGGPRVSITYLPGDRHSAHTIILIRTRAE